MSDGKGTDNKDSREGRVGRLVGWLVGWLAGWMVGWLDG